MQTDETELRRHLAATAASASTLQFTAKDVAVRVWRHRRRRTRIGAVASLAMAAVAAAVALPLGLGGAGASGSTAAGGQPSGVIAGPGKAVPLPAWTVTANGHALREGGPAEPLFDVAPGEKVTITMTVTVPADAQMTKFFLGVTGDSAGIGPRGPIGMNPVLATASDLGPGKHAFTVHWTVPRRAAPGGYHLAMAAYWPKETENERQAEEGPMVTFGVRS